MLVEANTLAYCKKIILNAKKCFITEKRNKSSWHPIIKKPFSDKSRKNSVSAGNTKRGSITVLLTSCLTGLDWPVLQIKTKNVSNHTADSKPVKQEVNGTVILPPSVFPGFCVKVIIVHIIFSPCAKIFARLEALTSG